MSQPDNNITPPTTSAASTPMAPRSSSKKKPQEDVDDFLSSLGVSTSDAPSADPPASNSNDSIKGTSDADINNSDLKNNKEEEDEDMLSFLNKLSVNKEDDESKEVTQVNKETELVNEETTSNKLVDEKSETASSTEVVAAPVTNSNSSSWSFGGLWNSASSAIKSGTQSTDYLMNNVTNIRSTINNLTESVRSNENAQFLNSAVQTLVTNEKLNQLGKGVKNFTQQSVTSVLTTLNQPIDTSDTVHKSLKIFLMSSGNQLPFNLLERVGYELLDSVLDVDMYQDVIFRDGHKLLEKVGETEVGFKVGQGFSEGNNLAKSLAQSMLNAFNKLNPNTTATNNNNDEKNKDQDQEQKQQLTSTSTTSILSQLESKLLIPTVITNLFISIQPCRAAPLPNCTQQFYTLTLLCHDYDVLLNTLTQPLPFACPMIDLKFTSVEINLKLVMQSVKLGLEFILIDFFNTKKVKCRVEEE